MAVWVKSTLNIYTTCVVGGNYIVYSYLNASSVSSCVVKRKLMAPPQPAHTRVRFCR